MDLNKKHDFLDLIQANIDQFGHHITIATNAIEPRYAYTIGVNSLLNFELIFAGGIYYLKDALLQIINEIVEVLKNKGTINDQKIMVGSLGTFSLVKVDSSWSRLMMLGAFDYYKTNDINAFQILPDDKHYTLDIPNMSNEWNAASEPVWQWLVRKWHYPAPQDSTVTTNTKALLGEAITEVTRWENNAWEMFAGAGPDVHDEDMRVVSLGTILGIDITLLPSLSLDIGKGLWRDSADSEWTNWG